MMIQADTFNGATEHYYRTDLKRLHTEEGLMVLAEDCERLEQLDDPHLRQVMAGLNRSAAAYVREKTASLLDETTAPDVLQNLLQIGLAVIHHERLKIR